MEFDTLYCQHRDDRGSDTDSVQEGLMNLSPGELKLLQEITLHQMGESVDQTQLLLGRVWHRLEQERLRRQSQTRELERMYFAR